MSSNPGHVQYQLLVHHTAFYRLFANMIFDNLVKGIVREHYHRSPIHVTLQVTHDDAALFIDAHIGGALLIEDDELRDWAYGFIGKEIFGINAADVDVIYLDGTVGGEDAYLHIAGKGIYLSSGQPQHRGNLQ